MIAITINQPVFLYSSTDFDLKPIVEIKAGSPVQVYTKNMTTLAPYDGNLIVSYKDQETNITYVGFLRPEKILVK